MNFKVGEYKTINGSDARVKFIISDPHRTDYPLVGEVLSGTAWRLCTWNLNGSRYGTRQTVWDLVPNKEWIYFVLTSSSIGTAYYEEPAANYIKVERLPNGNFDWANATIVVRYF